MSNANAAATANLGMGVSSIEGTVTYIINEKDRYKVLVLKSDSIPDHVKSENYPNTFIAVGNFLRVVVGQAFILKGKWENAKRGWRFVVETYEEVMPKGRDAMINFLSSSYFKGIGRKTAEIIVNAFGESALDVMRNHPERLLMVKGISNKKAADIIECSKESRYMEKLIFSLAPHGIPQKKIFNLYEMHGEETMDVVMENPYRLSNDLPGVDFEVCDSIAKVCGFLPNNLERISAAVKQVLSSCANVQGHTFLPYSELVNEVKSFLEDNTHMTGRIDVNDIVNVTVHLNNRGDIVIDTDESVFLPAYYSCEHYIAKKLSILMNNKRKKRFRLKTDDVIEEMEKEYGIKYSSKQKEGIRQAFNQVMVITGGPGTGKSTLLRAIIGLYERNFKNCKICLAAPTGRAAKRMSETTGYEAKTLHRLLECRQTSDGNPTFAKNEIHPIEADLIIVDEASMLDTILFSNLLKAVKQDTTLILVGDIDQIPSVGAGTVLRDVIESLLVPVVFLNEIFRQESTSKIIINADKINKGNIDLEYGDDFIFIEEIDSTRIPEIIVEQFCKELSDIKNINDILVITPYRVKTLTGSKNLNRLLQDKLNPLNTNTKEIKSKRGYNTFRNHDKVMQIVNNYDKNVFNGTMGLVINVDTAEGRLTVDFGDKTVDYFIDELDELQPAYAITIHKSQGSEVNETVIIPVTLQHKNMLQRNLIYTAVTRSKRKIILVGEIKALNYCIRNYVTDKRYSRLKNRIVDTFNNF